MTPENCSDCATSLEPDALVCAGCGRLTHSEQLRSFAAQAQTEAANGRPAESCEQWRKAMALLPPDSLQYRSIVTRVEELETRLAAEAPAATPRPWWKKLTGAAAPIGLMAWKFKALLFGLTKLSTLLSMFAFFGVYWALYGWTFALGLVLSIYIHEMGHVIAIRGYGFAASAPMFIPGLGAFIRLRTLSITPVQDARIGLAGPLYGLGAAALSLALFVTTHVPVLGVIAHFAAWMNLFNLIPVWQLDGSRGFRSLTRQQRGIVLATALVLFLAVHEGMLLLIAIAAGWRLFTKDSSGEPDNTALMQYAGLLVALSAIPVFTPLTGRTP